MFVSNKKADLCGRVTILFLIEYSLRESPLYIVRAIVPLSQFAVASVCSVSHVFAKHPHASDPQEAATRSDRHLGFPDIFQRRRSNLRKGQSDQTHLLPSTRPTKVFVPYTASKTAMLTYSTYNVKQLGTEKA